MTFISEIIKKYKVVLLLCLLVSSCYYVFFINRAHVELSIQVEKPTFFKIYWSEPGQLYSEKKMARVRVIPGRKNYNFFLTDLNNTQKLRIDTHQYKGEVFLQKLIISQKGLKSIEFEANQEFSKFIPLSQIENYKIGENGLQVRSSGKDPNFEFAVVLEKITFDWFQLLGQLFLLCLLVIIIYYSVRSLQDKCLYVPVLLTGVLFAIIIMASISARNVHPDEYVHLNAAKYYQHNWLPPVVDDPEIRNTYSVYGVSRLNSQETYYFFAGKFQNFLSPLYLSDFQTLRMFNVLLFSIILFYSFKISSARFLALPLLISPQLWYVFSYCNSDAFSLFVTFFTGCQLFLPQSMLNKFLKQERNWVFFGRAVALGILFGLLFLLKKNYYPYIVFLIFCLGLKLFQLQHPDLRKQVLIRLLMVLLVGLSIFGLRKGVDYYVNGFERVEKMATLREELATPLYKPSTELHKKHSFLYQKARGVSLETIIKIDRWFEKTFRSAFGVYGYFTVSGPLTYYDVVRWTGAFFFVFFLTSIFLRFEFSNSITAVVGLLLSIGLIGASLWHSWAADFQAQGRYLFPVVPIISIICYQSQKIVSNLFFTLFLTAMFLLSTYSFIWVALQNIPKIAFN